jgi:hypothetical protein
MRGSLCSIVDEAYEAAHEGSNEGANEGPNEATNEGPNKGANKGPNKAAHKGTNKGANEGANEAAHKGPAEKNVCVRVNQMIAKSTKAIIPPANEYKKLSVKIEKFIQVNNLNKEVKEVFDYLFNHPSHHPLVAGPGISSTVDAPYGVNCKLNILRASYLCQNFSENIRTKKKTTKRRTVSGQQCHRKRSINGRLSKQV